MNQSEAQFKGKVYGEEQNFGKQQHILKLANAKRMSESLLL
jgi:hypothetical protein